LIKLSAIQFPTPMRSRASTKRRERVADTAQAIAHIPAELAGTALDVFEADWRRRRLVERGIEIISEAARRLPDELESASPEDDREQNLMRCSP